MRCLPLSAPAPFVFDLLQATVLHAVRKMSAERQQMTELNQQLHVLEQTLKG